MDFKTLFGSTKRASKIATVIIFLALIRCICEPFRLQYYAASSLTFAEIKPFLLGALAAASGLFAMIVLFYFEKYKISIAVCILTITALLIIKATYLTF